MNHRNERDAHSELCDIYGPGAVSDYHIGRTSGDPVPDRSCGPCSGDCRQGRDCPSQPSALSWRLSDIAIALVLFGVMFAILFGGL